MVVTAHPDDSEFGAGGTVAKLVKEGREVTYVIVTNGNKGSSDRSMTPERLAKIREEEQRNAARTLGVARAEFLGYPDCEVEDTRALRRDVTRQIRKWKPDLLIAQNPRRTYNLGGSHRDHRIAAGAGLADLATMTGPATMTDRAIVVASLRATPGLLRHLTADAKPAQATTPPAPGQWSIAEVVRYLVEGDRDTFVPRLRRIVAETL